MSDAIYQQQAARRTRVWILTGGIIGALACLIFGTMSVLRDDCTNSFDRAPQSVIMAYSDAVGAGDGATLRRCWQPSAYFDLASGCSEICLERFLNAQYQVVNLSLSDPQITPQGREHILATVSIACADSGETQAGVITLDGLARNLPWRHWKIVQSTFGGNPAQPWCK